MWRGLVWVSGFMVNAARLPLLCLDLVSFGRQRFVNTLEDSKMTHTADHAFEPAATISIAHTLNGSRLIMRIGLRFGATTMTLVALLVWLAPGAGWESDIMLFKLLLSIMSGLLAVGLWQASLPPLPPTVVVDVAASELRLIREGVPAESRVLERCSFQDLHLVEMSGPHFTFWGQGNRLLADITLSNAAIHASLLGALRSAGKLI
jgi:hypothetical protein